MKLRSGAELLTLLACLAMPAPHGAFGGTDAEPEGPTLSAAENRDAMLLLHLDEKSAEVRDTGQEDYAVSVHEAQPGLPGRFGTAFGFDGEDDYIEVDGMLCFSSQTILLWVKHGTRTRQ